MIAATTLTDGLFELSRYLFSIAAAPEKQDRYEFFVGSCLGDTQAMAQAIASVSVNEMKMSEFQGLIAFSRLNPRGLYESDPIHCAILKGQPSSINFIRELTLQGADFPITENHLTLALRTGNIDVLVALCRFSNRPENFVTSRSLVHAASSGNLSMVRWVLEEAEKINVAFGENDIDRAIVVAKSQEVLVFLTRKYERNLAPNGLSFAAQHGYKEIIDFYLNSKQWEAFDVSPLILAAQNAIYGNHTVIFNALFEKLSHRFSQEMVDYLLPIACQKDNLEAIQLLLSAPTPANPAAFDNMCLKSAAVFGSVKAMERIVGTGNQDLDPAAYNNAAFIQAVRMRHYHVLAFLVSLHEKYPAIDPAAQDNRAFRIAAYTGDIKTARYLLSLRNKFPAISPSARDNSPIKLAVSAGQSGMVQFLLSLPQELGVDKRIAEMDKETIQVENVAALMNHAMHN